MDGNKACFAIVCFRFQSHFERSWVRVFCYKEYLVDKISVGAVEVVCERDEFRAFVCMRLRLCLYLSPAIISQSVLICIAKGTLE